MFTQDVKVGKKATNFNEAVEVLTEKSMADNKISTVDQHMASSDMNVDARTLTSEATKVDQLPKKMHDMKMRDDKVVIQDEKVCTMYFCLKYYFSVKFG